MSVKNTTQNTNHQVQRDNITADIPVETWETEPGGKVLLQTTFSDLPLNSAIAIFKKLITEKIPRAIHLLKELGHTNHSLKEFHLPLPLGTIFFTFVDELVEHYQNQLDQRDDNLDQQFKQLKRLLAKNHTQIWPKDNDEIRTFMSLLKTKLSQVDAKLEKFDPMVNLWSEILNIQYIANMTLLGIYLPSNYTSSHRLPTNKEKDSTFIQVEITH